MNAAALRPFAFLAVALLALSAAPLHAQREKLPPEDLELVEKKWPEAKRTYTGLRYIVLKAGKKDGPAKIYTEAGAVEKTLVYKDDKLVP